MWAVLVVNILNKDYDRGRIYAPQQRLRDIPADLHQLFYDMLTRDFHDRDELLLCIQWILFPKHPLQPEELYFAILSGVQPGALSETCHSDNMTVEDVRRYILSASKGLAEFTKSRAPTIQFIHESVRDFLLKEGGVSALFIEPGGDNFEGQSHDRLKSCCLTYLAVAARSSSNRCPDKVPLLSRTGFCQITDDSLPFLQYAVRNVLYHANAAQGAGVPQLDFLQNFALQLAHWIELYRLFNQELYSFSPNASILYVLARTNMSNLIRRHPDKLQYLVYEDEPYCVPLFAALVNEENDAFRAFLQAEVDNEADNESRPASIHERYKRLIQRKHDSISPNTSVSKPDGSNFHSIIFSSLIERKDDDLLAFLLEAGKTTVTADFTDFAGLSPLVMATRKGHAGVVKFLVDSGKFDIEAKDLPYQWTLLSCAVFNGHEAVVRVLLDTGKVDVNTKDNGGWTPICRAAERGFDNIVKLLLDTSKVDVHSRDTKFGRTPLDWAKMYCKLSTVKLLLAYMAK